MFSTMCWLIVEKERDVIPSLNPPPTACARHSESGVALTLLAPLRTAPFIPLVAASAAAVHMAGVRKVRVVRSAFRLRRVRMTMRRRFRQ